MRSGGIWSWSNQLMVNLIESSYPNRVMTPNRRSLFSDGPNHRLSFLSL